MHLSENPQQCYSQSKGDPCFLLHHSWCISCSAKGIASVSFFICIWDHLLYKLIRFHHFSVVFLFGNTLVAAIVLLCHVGDEVQAVRLHLQTRAALASMLPGVNSVVRVYRTGQIERDTQWDRVSCPQIHWWWWSRLPFGPVYLFLFYKNKKKIQWDGMKSFWALSKCVWISVIISYLLLM